MKEQSQTKRRVASEYQNSHDVMCKKVMKAVVIRNREVRYMRELLEKFVIIAEETENLNIELKQ